MINKLNYAQSRNLYERANRVLAGGVSSEFRRFSYPHPLFYSHGKGSKVYDVDANEYLDFTLSQGPLILGHSHPYVIEKVARSSANGQLFAGQYVEELELAEKIQQFVPCAELMRFCLSGSEAVHAALRVARAVTGRTKFLRFGDTPGLLPGCIIKVSVSLAGDCGISRQHIQQRRSITVSR
ncbi:MAG: aminotransferase class III-fold pyridoxal phosphate-dependent enzyme [Ktedonobacteraceae bacterium]